MSNYGYPSQENYNYTPESHYDRSEQHSPGKTQAKQRGNASTYNPIRYHPESQAALEEVEKLQRKEKQFQYKDQLDQMMSRNQTRNQYDHDNRSPGPGGNQYQGSMKGSYQEPLSSFQQQDRIRDQLLDKIRHGYSKFNSNVYNQYQEAHESKTKEREDFEKNVVERAANQRIAQEDMRARTEWEKKKKLEQDTLLSNKRVLETNETFKRRQKAEEEAREARFLQDTLLQFEEKNSKQKEAERRRREENNRVLQQQMRDQTMRKKENDVAWDPQKQRESYEAYNADFYNALHKVGDNKQRSSVDVMSKEPNPQPYTKVGTLGNFDAYPKDNRYNSKTEENLNARMENLNMQDNYGRENYSPQKDIYGPPKDSYGGQKDIYAPQKDIYAPQKDIYAPPKDIYSSQTNIYAPEKDNYYQDYSAPSGSQYPYQQQQQQQPQQPTYEYKRESRGKGQFAEPSTQGYTHDRIFSSGQGKEEALPSYGHKFDTDQRKKISDRIRQGVGYNIISNDR